MSTIPFQCSCCKAQIDSLSAWQKLPVIGYTCFSNDAAGPEQHIEQRNCCSCSTTLAIYVSREHVGCSLHRAARRSSNAPR